MPASSWAATRVAAALAAIAPLAELHTARVQPRLERVLEAFAAERVGVQHFASVSGYGHGDVGREVLDRVFARVLQAEAAAVRLQFVSGTHAIAAALYGVLRPGDRLLALTGRPYDTLEEVIGIRGNGQGSWPSSASATTSSTCCLMAASTGMASRTPWRCPPAWC